MLVVGLVVNTMLSTLTLLNSEVKVLQNERNTLVVENNKLTVELKDIKSELEKKTEAAITLEKQKWEIKLDTQKEAAEKQRSKIKLLQKRIENITS